MMAQKTGFLNKMLIQNNRQKVLYVLSAPDIVHLLRIQDEKKQTPIFIACQNLQENLALEIVPKMIERGADPLKLDINLQTVIYYVAKNEKDRLLSYLVNNFPFNINNNDYMMQTPLFYAASNGSFKCARILIDKKANVNHIDKNGQNCLFWAAGQGSIQVCKLLVNNNIDYLQKDVNKQQAIIYARRNNHIPIINYFQQLKNNSKRTKQIKQMSIRMESSHQQSKGGVRKKKQLMKSPYCLIYTNQKGQVHQLTVQEIQKFANLNDQHRKIIQLINRPEKLESYPLPEQKKFQKICQKIITHFMKHQQGSLFLYPVDPVALNIPTYFQIIKHPMDFTTIKIKLSYNAYDSEADFCADMNLVFDNCTNFNGLESGFGKVATQMRLQFNTMYRKQFGI